MKDEFKDLFYSKLDLGRMSFNVQSLFLNAMTKYMMHGRHDDEVTGRTYEFLSEKLDVLIKFFEAVDCSKDEMVKIITSFPSIFNNADELYSKYLFLGIVEDPETNDFRKYKLVNKPMDYMVSLKKIYARYKMMIAFGYDDISWNNLVHVTDSEFCKIFVKGKYKKPYKEFDNEEDAMNFLNNIDVSDFDLESIKSWDVNKEIVARYEEKERRY